MLSIQRIDSTADDLQSALDALREKLSPRGDVVSESGRKLTIETFGQPLTPQQVVEKICCEVRDQGLPSLLEYSRKLDKADLDGDSLRVPAEELAAAHRQADPEFLATIRRIRDNILEFQTAILHRDVEIQRPHGVTLRQRYLPLERVGVCVPGGAAAYPSTVPMTVVPAQAAGVSQIAVIAPPTPLGAHNPDLLAVCHELEIEEVYRMGGAQGIAALAYGVEGVPAVDKIVGPGNLFVALAKKFVYGQVDIDSIAGPGEVVVIAGPDARADFIASDLLAQAEHAPGASILVTWDAAVRDAVAAELERQAALLSRSELTLQSLQDFAALILVQDADEACRITDAIAPEHLHIATEDAEQLLAKIRHAGATFLGHYTPVALGDYVAGPSHVLPTGGTARWASGLSANQFLRAGSVIAYTEKALNHDADDVRLMAEKEGLTAHRESVEIRRGK